MIPDPTTKLAQCVHSHIEVGSLDMNGRMNLNP